MTFSIMEEEGVHISSYNERYKKDIACMYEMSSGSCKERNCLYLHRTLYTCIRRKSRAQLRKVFKGFGANLAELKTDMTRSTVAVAKVLKRKAIEDSFKLEGNKILKRCIQKSSVGELFSGKHATEWQGSVQSTVEGFGVTMFREAPGSRTPTDVVEEQMTLSEQVEDEIDVRVLDD